MMHLRLFAHEMGPIHAWLRVSRGKQGAPALPDLFDRLDAVMETRNEGRTWFLREYVVARRFSGIGNSYRSLRCASRFAALMLKNPIHEEAWSRLFESLEKGFESWEAGAAPEVVYFKMLYLFARDEGFPVREDWWRRLPSRQRAEADQRLHLPLSEQPGSDTAPEKLIENLERWLQGHHEIRF